MCRGAAAPPQGQGGLSLHPAPHVLLLSLRSARRRLWNLSALARFRWHGASLAGAWLLPSPCLGPASGAPAVTGQLLLGAQAHFILTLGGAHVLPRTITDEKRVKATRAALSLASVSQVSAPRAGKGEPVLPAFCPETVTKAGTGGPGADRATEPDPGTQR